jgi:hypothetical protein
MKVTYGGQKGPSATKSVILKNAFYVKEKLYDAFFLVVPNVQHKYVIGRPEMEEAGLLPTNDECLRINIPNSGNKNAVPEFHNTETQRINTVCLTGNALRNYAEPVSNKILPEPELPIISLKSSRQFYIDAETNRFTVDYEIFKAPILPYRSRAFKRSGLDEEIIRKGIEDLLEKDFV